MRELSARRRGLHLSIALPRFRSGRRKHRKVAGFGSKFHHRIIHGDAGGDSESSSVAWIFVQNSTNRRLRHRQPAPYSSDTTSFLGARPPFFRPPVMDDTDFRANVNGGDGVISKKIYRSAIAPRAQCGDQRRRQTPRRPLRLETLAMHFHRRAVRQSVGGSNRPSWHTMP